MENKTDLRIKAKTIRKGLDIKNISKKLCEKILDMPEYQKAKNVMIFYPLVDEIDLLSLASDKKNFYLPRVKDDDIEVCPYKNGDELVIGKYNILEPKNDTVSPDVLDLVIVPAIMADKNNNRLGYGKGYYDRFLNKVTATILLPLPKELIVENLPVEPFDKKVDVVVTV